MRSALILAALGSAAFAQPPGPNAVELFLLSAQAEKANSEKISEYTYGEYKVTQEIDKDDKATHRQTETWDVIGLEGSTYRKLILRNDQALEPKEQKREDERLAKETALRRKETSEQRRKRSLSFSFTYSVRGLEPERTVALFDFEFKGEEEVDGRAAYVIEGMPKPGARPANANEKENLNYRMKMWIDREDHVRSRSESEVIGEHSRAQKGTVIELRNARNEVGAWLPKEFRFRFNLQILKVGHARGDIRLAYSDYRRFQVDSQVVEAKP
jgi:hypothetical protein